MAPESGNLASSTLPPPVAEFFQSRGGIEIPSLSLKLLTIWESKRLLENWPRYGFSRDRGYIPIAEDKNGDLFCVAGADDIRGQVYHLAWADGEEFRFDSLRAFVAACAAGA